MELGRVGCYCFVKKKKKSLLLLSDQAEGWGWILSYNSKVFRWTVHKVVVDNWDPQAFCRGGQ